MAADRAAALAVEGGANAGARTRPIATSMRAEAELHID